MNGNTGTLISGGRQGWDITNVDVSGRLTNGQTTAFVQGTRSSSITADQYLITDLGLQINIGAPRWVPTAKSVDKTTTFVGDILTYTLALQNIGQVDGTNVVFTDQLPPGTTFVPNSFTRNGTVLSGANPASGVNIGDVPVNMTVTLTFQVQVTSVPPSPLPAEFDNKSSWTYQYVSCAALGTQSGNFETNIVVTRIALVDGSKTVSPATAVPNDTLTYTVTIPNTGTANASNVTLTDAIPAGTTYVLGSTTLNGTPVPDAAGTMMPFAQGGLVNSPGAPAGQVNAGETATVQFQVRVSAAASGTVTNTATIDPDAKNPALAPFTRQASTTVTPQADLSVTKTGPARVTAGTEVAFTIVVTNNGPSNAANVIVTDPAPAGLTSVSSTGACAAFPSSLGTVPADTSQTITATYFVPPGYTAPDPITNTVTVSSDTNDPAPSNNTATASVALNAPVATLAVTKTNGVTSVVAGTQTTYTITVTNEGPSDVSGVTVSDPLPAGVSSASWTCTATGGSCAPASGTGAINTMVSLPVNTHATLSLTATVAPNATGNVVNVVTATNPPNFGSPGSASATDTDTITHSADVSITKTGPATVVPGNSAVYTIVVTNAGPSTANDVVVSDPTPEGLAFVSNSGACTTAFPCALGTLAPGDSRTITTTFTVPLGYTTPNPIAQTASVASSTTDPTPGNNTATVQTSVDTDADVAVAKSVVPTSALVGDTVTLFISATNNGPNQASGVVVTDKLPAGLAFASASPSQGDYSPADGKWTVGTLPNGEGATLTLTAQVTQAGTLTNIATKTFANEPDPDTSNDTAEGTLNTAAAADVGIQKVVDNNTPAVGENVTFTVTATNHGPSDATGVVVTDALPAGLTLVSATPSQGDYVAASGVWTVGALTNNASATLTLVATVTTSGMLVNTAEKTAQTEADPNPANDRKSVSLNATTMADIQVAKAVSNETPAVGDQVTFTVTATNAGPSPATGVEVTDVLPPGLSFVSATPSQGSYASGTGVWTVGSLAATQSAVLSLTALVDETGTLTNTAEKTASDVEDPNPDNDSGSATVTAGGWPISRSPRPAGSRRWWPANPSPTRSRSPTRGRAR